MKKTLLFISSFLIALTAFSQAVPNGGFESWNFSSADMPDNYAFTSNPQVLQLGMAPNVIKVSDPQQGTLAIQMNTITNGVDTAFGYFINGDPTSGAGGIPYAQHPITLTGFYKSNVMAGDTALILIQFKEAGLVVSFDAIGITGVHSSYTPFTISLTIPPLANPDSIVFGAVSSNAFVTNGIPGSMLQLDNLTFTGVASQPLLMNGSFENWTSINTSMPLQWATAGDLIHQTTDSHSGSFALTMNTFAFDPNNISPSYATNGMFPPQSGPQGGRPYSLMADTLCGWYKYTVVGTDSATVGVQTTNMGNPVGGSFVGLPPVSVYTFFSVPFSSFTTPDTLMVILSSSYNDVYISNVGSVFKVDDLYLKSSLTGIAPEISWNAFGKVAVYPNPSNVECWIDFDNNSSNASLLTITDETGKLISETSVTGFGHQHEHIDTSVLAKGSYMITLSQNGKRVTRKLIVQ